MEALLILFLGVAELHVLADLAAQKGKVAPVSLRVNPDVAAHTHKNITTGLAENKFGIHYSILEFWDIK